MAYENHWLPGCNFDVEEWGASGQIYETLAICRSLALACATFEVAIAEKHAGRFMIRNRTRVVKRHPEGDWCAAPCLLMYVNKSLHRQADNIWMPAILFLCPTTGLRVRGWIVDYPIAQPEHDHEGYEPVTCLACERVHLVNPKTGEVLGPPLVRTVGHRGAVRTWLLRSRRPPSKI